MNDAVACPACGGRASVGMIATDVNRRTTSESFTYYRCRHCALMFVHPQPIDISRYYPCDYVAPPQGVAYLRRIAGRIRYQIDLLRRFAQKGRLLEIGPGYGSFLWLAREAGFETEAIDADETGARFVREIVGVRVTSSASPHEIIASVPDARYQAIVLWHSLEHLPDPWTTLQQAARALAPGGALLIATPNPEARQFAMLGTRWPHVDAPRHLWLVPLRVLEHHLAPLGLQLALATTDDPGGRQWNRFGWSQALVNLLPAFLRQTVVARLVTRAAGWAIATTLQPWERMPMKGAAYTAVFVKPMRV